MEVVMEGVTLSSEVLIVEDEREIRELIGLHLNRTGFRVRECESAESALSNFERSRYSLVILDWMLPGKSGVDLIRDLRIKDPEVSILMLTARTEPQDIVFGLDKGADDFLTKPFDVTILMARVRALMRRRHLIKEISEAGGNQAETFELDGLLVDFQKYNVHLNGEDLHLTPSEFKLLSTLLESRGKALTRELLIEKVHGEGVNVIGRTIDTHVFGLRKKLLSWGSHIETIRGVGYRVRLS